MGSALEKALELIMSADPELLNILGTTARMSLSSSVIASAVCAPMSAQSISSSSSSSRSSSTRTKLFKIF